MIRLEEACKVFGNRAVVDRLSFQLEPGGVTGLLGANGAGKTTTMRLITGFFEPSSGKVFVDGKERVARDRRLRARIGYLPENNPLYDDYTVVEHLHMAAGMRGLGGKSQSMAVGKVRTLCRLDEVLKERVAHLSKGFRQRLGLAQALLGDPHILILDEPATGLDPVQAMHMNQLISQLAEERTLLLSTHHLDQAMSICSKLLVLQRGRLIFDGSPLDFQQTQPVSRAVLMTTATLDIIKSRLLDLPFLDKVIPLPPRDGFLCYRLEGDLGGVNTSVIMDKLNGLNVSQLAASPQSAEHCFAEMVGAEEA